MNINIFKGLAEILSIDNYKIRSQLSKDFNLYLQTDMLLALSMLDNGYKPSFMQQNNMEEMFLKESNNVNFLNKFHNAFHHISNKALINYFVSHDLSIKCNNDKTIYQNNIAKLETLKERKGFYKEVKQALLSSLNKHGQIASKFKPKYEYTHGFEFNKKEQKIYNTFTSNIYNSLILMNLIVDSVNDFLEIKSNIQSNIVSIKQLVQKNNYKIIGYDGELIHNHRFNVRTFKIELLDGWIKYLDEYNVDKLKADILDKTKATFTKAELSNDLTVVQETPKKEKACETTEQILLLKSELNLDCQNKIIKIIEVYNQLREKHNNPETSQDQENLYKDLHKAIKKFVSIDVDYRNTLKNVEGKTPEELMNDSINMIETKFNDYITAINQDKVHDLSAHQKKIKMKA